MGNSESDMRDRHENVGIILMRGFWRKRAWYSKIGKEENEKQSR